MSSHGDFRRLAKVFLSVCKRPLSSERIITAEAVVVGQTDFASLMFFMILGC